MIDCDVVVIGAGAIVLATAAQLVENGLSVIIVEKERLVGSHSTSRNSEVIHSGIYYKESSAKETFCLEGKERLYSFLLARGVPFNNCGKILFCNDINGQEKLESLYQNAKRCEIKVKYCEKAKLEKVNQIANATAAVEVYDTGIFDSHVYLQSLINIIENHGGILALNTDVIDLDANYAQLKTVCRQNLDDFIIRSKYVINAAGSNALNLLKSYYSEKYSSYSNFFVKGHYFSCKRFSSINQLYYPLPNDLGLGVHLTCDLNGAVKLVMIKIILRMQ